MYKFTSAGAWRVTLSRPGEESIVIHFTACGLTALGQAWHRGQELEVSPAHPLWPEAAGWISLTPEQQAERWGEQKFALGTVPGRVYCFNLDRQARYVGTVAVCEEHEVTGEQRFAVHRRAGGVDVGSHLPFGIPERPRWQATAPG
jgi:hypothetical protein